MRFKDVPLDSEEVVHLKLALQSWLDCYFRLTDPLPKDSFYYAHAAGAFGELQEITAELLARK